MVNTDARRETGHGVSFSPLVNETHDFAESSSFTAVPLNDLSHGQPTQTRVEQQLFTRAAIPAQTLPLEPVARVVPERRNPLAHICSSYPWPTEIPFEISSRVPPEVYEHFVETLNGQYGAAKFSCTFKLLMVGAIVSFPFFIILGEVFWQLFAISLFTGTFWLAGLALLGGAGICVAACVLVYCMHRSIINGIERARLLVSRETVAFEPYGLYCRVAPMQELHFFNLADLDTPVEPPPPSFLPSNLSEKDVDEV